MKRLIALFAMLALPAFADCSGQNLIPGLAAPARAALAAAVATYPFPTGNAWRAVKPGSTITIIGTLHLYDPRMEGMMQTLGPLVDAADLVLAEASPEAEAQLKSAIAANPALLIRPTGPTLPEVLTKAEWAALSAELTARGVPPFMAAKFQPWYVSMLLGIPTCAIAALADGPTGLDQMVMNRAARAGIPILSLEPYDTVFRAFGALSDAEQITMIRAALVTIPGAADQFATLTAAYFAGQHRQIWEFTRQQAATIPGTDPGQMAADFNLMEQALLTGRTVPWMDVLLPGAMGKTVVVAVGAAHLSGEKGLLYLLQQAGYTLTEIPLLPQTNPAP